MNQESSCSKAAISLLLRLSAVSIFAAAVAGKIQMGFGGVAPMFQQLFKDTWPPMPLVTLHAHLTPWLEILLPLWLLSGFRLRAAWFVSTLFMILLAFGMMVAKNFPVAASNYFYVLLFCAGLYFSEWDKLQIGCCKKTCGDSAPR